MRDRLLFELASLVHDDVRSQPSPEGIADILWMARLLRSPASSQEETVLTGDWPDEIAGDGAEEEKVDAGDALLHPFRGIPGSENAELRPAMEVRVPAVSALPDAMEIARALRPLKRSAARVGRPRLAEDETAAYFGDTGLIWPIVKTSPERSLRLDLVVDTSASMGVWQQTAHELLRLLQHHGTFRDVRAWAINGDEPTTRLTPLSKRASRSLLPHAAGELVAPGGQRMVLVLTDTVGRGWSHGVMRAYLQTWTRSSPTAILQVLPRRLWHRTRARVTRVTAHIRIAAQPPLRITRPIMAGVGQDRVKESVTWVPVVPLRGDWIKAWAVIAAGNSGESVQVFAMPVPDENPGHSAVPTDDASMIRSSERLHIFQQDPGSAQAVELAGYLAAAPLTLPIMRLVQHAMMPQSRPEHLAEVFLSGLLARVDQEISGTSDPDEVRYEFREGIREELLGKITRGESLRVLDVLAGVSKALSLQFGGTLDFRALVPSGDAGDNRLAPESKPFAKVAISVLDGMGGKYSELAETLLRAGFAAPVFRAGLLDQSVNSMETLRETTTDYREETSRDRIDSAHPAASQSTSQQPQAADLAESAQTEDVRPVTVGTPFYLSHAPSGGASDGMMRKFFESLTGDVSQLVSVPRGHDIGFANDSQPDGASWLPETMRALSTCQVLVALLSAPYLQSEWCGREWDAFSRRTTVPTSKALVDHAKIISVLWAPLTVTIPVKISQHTNIFAPKATHRTPDLPQKYAENGIFGLMMLNEEEAVSEIVWQLAKVIQETYYSRHLESLSLDALELTNMFQKDEP